MTRWAHLIFPCAHQRIFRKSHSTAKYFPLLVCKEWELLKLSLIVFEIYLNYVYVCECLLGYVHVNAVTERPEEPKPLELGLQLSVSCLAWVLETELGSSQRAVFALSRWAVSSAPI